jgi:hypothetical protein
MCRWLAYSGAPVLLEDLLHKPKNSLVVQSLHSQLGAETTNGDGFGVGWYGAGASPGVFRSTEPAWNDRNLRELAGQIRARGADQVAESARPHPGIHGLPGAADELSSVPARPVAFHAQRLHRQPPHRPA